jgi:hypothetical protein
MKHHRLRGSHLEERSAIVGSAATFTKAIAGAENRCPVVLLKNERH